MDSKNDLSPELSQNGVLQKTPSMQRKWLWTVFALVVAVATVWAVTSSARGFSADGFWDYLMHANPFWLCMAVVCMFGFIWFEGAALAHICRSFGYRASMRDGLVYSSADIYFSSITPSASGGQPASAYFMIRQGVPTMVTTVALMVNLVMYTLSIVVLGLLSVLVDPGVFAGLRTLSKVLVIAGSMMQTGLVVFSFMLLRRGRVLHLICDGLLRLLGKLHLLRRVTVKRAKLKRSFDQYAEYAKVALNHKRMLIGAFLFNFLQRISQLLVAVCCYLATGGSPKGLLDIWTTQNFVVLGSNCIPVPGAMGVADFLMLDGYGKLMSEDATVNLELLTRSVSFYSCIVICGITVLIAYFLRRKKGTTK